LGDGYIAGRNHHRGTAFSPVAAGGFRGDLADNIRARISWRQFLDRDAQRLADFLRPFLGIGVEQEIDEAPTQSMAILPVSLNRIDPSSSR